MIRWARECQMYSLDFTTEDNEVRLSMRTWDKDVLHRVTLLVEPATVKFPSAELSCLGRVLACFPLSQRPVSVTGTCSTVVAAYDRFNKTRIRGLTYCEFGPDVFRRHFKKCAHFVFGTMEPFTVVEHLVLRLRSAIGEPWMEGLTTLTRCCLAQSADFDCYPDLVLDILSAWNDIYFFVKDTGTARSSLRRLEASGMDGHICSDKMVPVYLELFYVIICDCKLFCCIA